LPTTQGVWGSDGAAEVPKSNDHRSYPGQNDEPRRPATTALNFLKGHYR